MHQLTKQQKIENLEEVNRRLQEKVIILQKQINYNNAKIAKLSKADCQTISSDRINTTFGGI